MLPWLGSSSADSDRRPKTIMTRPAWLNLMIMSEPLSMAQMLSSLSMRTRVGFGPGVEALADFAQELALGTELEQLRRRGAIGRTAGAVGAREHEDVALGIDGDARDFAEIHPRRKLEESRERNRREFQARFADANDSGASSTNNANRQVFIGASRLI